MDFVSVSLCLLIGELRPLILKVINDICVFTVVNVLILGVVFSVAHCFNNYGFEVLSAASLLCSFFFLSLKYYVL